MDRRIQKSKTAIYQAFISLLNQKAYDKMTVQEIIDLANVGRSTFYAHFDTKEALLEELCQELFQHTFIERQEDKDLFGLTAHIFSHFRKNQDRIATLLLSKNSYFLSRLKEQLSYYLFPLVREQLSPKKADLPLPFLEHYVTSTFIETASWWLLQRQPIDEKEITRYYLTLMA
ncbi:TetR/AcrR family transcriptional regulator [Streptococcus ferus]|uniref:TetR/AcrR family transcriptional regulator n=1 Tax=Streptococcus ferus TaxID=1345 RepID=UPI003516902E